MEKEEVIAETKPLLERIADSLAKQQKLYEIEVLCKVAETAKTMAKCSMTCYHEQGYVDAEMLTKIAVSKSKEFINQEGK